MPAPRSSRSEDLRQLEHLIPIAFAFLIRYLSWLQALTLALLAVVYGAFVSTRLWRAARRPEETERSFSPGKLAYAVAVFLLILLFPDEKHVVVVVWANLSVGDAVSNVVGRRFGAARLPWNHRKSWAGTASGFVASTLAALILLWWTGIPSPAATFWRRAWLYALLTSLVCSLVESAPLPIDDNITICASGAAFLVWLTQASWPAPLEHVLLALGAAICLSAALAAFLLRTVSPGGAAWGVIQGTIVFYSLGLPGFSLLATFFAFGSAFSRLGYRRKQALGVAQADSGRRNARHVWGKGFAPCTAAAAALFLAPKQPACLAFVAALAASLYDTTATELGQLHRGRPVLLPSLRRVPCGTRGAISLTGSVAGLLLAGVLVVEGMVLGMVSGPQGIWCVLAATISTHLESYLAARSPDTTSGPVMNAFHTSVSMLLALLLHRTLS